MFRRLHIQMTFFSALIIGIVIFIMTTACNFIAENSTGQNAWNTFQNNAISCISHLETQSIISSDWILQAEKNYDISMDIRDNGNSLYLKKLQTDSLDETIFRKAEEISALDLSNPGAVSKLTKRIFFQMKDFYVSTALIPKSHGTVSMIILYSLDSVKHKILLQRLAFSGAAFLAILALSICSWFFTGRMITPLEKSRQEQTEFIAAASHELRSPLAVILSGISAMKKADSKEQGHFLSVIEKEGTRMSLLINDMLSLSNADNHSWKMHPVSCELDTLLLDTYEKYEPLMQDHHMKFFIELPEEEIPPCPCDPERISQVLGILLDNAISYVPENGKIILSLSQTKTHFLIRVKDNGPGIPDSAKTSVFRRFYRADSARNNRQHFGLGLCIAYEIISLHKGTISVLDTPGGGSTFQISLPLA
jgi:signal transduction histidine kinase